MSKADSIKLAQRHEKLRELMTAKVVKLVGHKLSDAEKDRCMQEVDLLLHRGDATEQALQLLANQLRALTPAPGQGRGKAGGSQVSATMAAAHAPSGGSAVNVHAAAKRADAAVGTKPATKPPSAPATMKSEFLLDPEDDQVSRQRCRVAPAQVAAEDLWAKIAQKEVEAFNRDTLQYRRSLKKKEEEQRLFLDTQVQVRKQKAVAVREDEKKYGVEEQRQLDVWRDEERRQAEARKRRFAEEKASRDAQLELAKDKRAREEAKRKIEDELAAARDRAAYEKEQEAIKERRIRAREEVVKAQQFNAEFNKVKAGEKAKERAEDVKHQQMFLERLAKQDAEREMNLVKMQEKQRRQQQIAFQMESTLADKAKVDEEKAEEYRHARVAKAEAEERARAEKAAAAAVKQRQYLVLQMLEHEERRKAEREKFLAEKEAAKESLEAAERKEHEKTIRAKEAAQKHRREIEAQMAMKAKVKTTYMSDAERKLNMPLLAKSGVPTPSPTVDADSPPRPSWERPL